MKIIVTTLLSFTLIVNSFAQTTESVKGVWYMIDQSGESSQRLIISENEIKTERWVSYNVDQPYWKEDKTVAISYFESNTSGAVEILTSDSRSEGLSPGELLLSKDRQVLFMYNMRKGFTDQDEALSALGEFKFKTLMSRPVYRKKRLDQINALPSTAKMNKDEFIKLVKVLQSHDKVLSDFLTESNVNNAQRMLFYITDNLFKQGIIQMGYNPWKPTDTYFVERLKKEPEVSKLLENQVHFRF